MKEIAAAARKRLLTRNKQVSITPNHTKNIIGTSREAEASSDTDKENTNPNARPRAKRSRKDQNSLDKSEVYAVPTKLSEKMVDEVNRHENF